MSRDASRRDVITGRIIPPAQREPELHVSSLVVHARPERVDDVRRALAAMAGVEIHGDPAGGKFVVTLETENTKKTVAIMDAIRALPGVLDTVLVYQHAEPLSALEEEVQP